MKMVPVEEGGKEAAYANALWVRCRLVTSFIHDFVLPKIDAWQESDHAGQVLWEHLQRIYWWMRTLATLDESCDYQAVTAGCRSILESSIDIALIMLDPPKFEKLLAWEQSNKFRHAKCVAEYFELQASRKKKDPAAVTFEPTLGQVHMIKWVDEHEQFIKELRAANGWFKDKEQTKPTHPDRWTGKSLLDNARDADAVHPDVKFEHFYETRYRELCWDAHGSGLVGRRGLNAAQRALDGALAYRDASNFALISAQLVLQHVGVYDAETTSVFEAHLAKAIAAQDAVLKALGFGPPADPPAGDGGASPPGS
jgi:hypothetical protein